MPKPSPRFDTLAAATGWTPAARPSPSALRSGSAALGPPFPQMARVATTPA